MTSHGDDYARPLQKITIKCHSSIDRIDRANRGNYAADAIAATSSSRRVNANAMSTGEIFAIFAASRYTLADRHRLPPMGGRSVRTDGGLFLSRRRLNAGRLNTHICARAQFVRRKNQPRGEIRCDGSGATAHAAFSRDVPFPLPTPKSRRGPGGDPPNALRVWRCCRQTGPNYALLFS
jgi:hypothetical protein